MKEFQAFKDTLSNKTLKDIYEESKLEVQNETTEGTEAFSVALATQMAINLLESYEKWLKEERAKEENEDEILIDRQDFSNENIMRKWIHLLR